MDLDAGCRCGDLLYAGTGTGAGFRVARAKHAADLLRTAPAPDRGCHHLALGLAAAR